MRWIFPGTFWMGSPEDEPGRNEDEALHLVTLTEGFWLADTPCTQAFWQAVVGDNPSAFGPSPERPVEGVSWKDVQRFMAAFSQRVPGFEARLPTEAEWEYACRAGTETATYAGSLEILGERNAPTLDCIAWYSGNSGFDKGFEGDVDSSGDEKQVPHTRAATHVVAQKKPNTWGLYDTLGNVWEWCQDRYAPYGADETASLDPTGPPRGTFRVFRGGSWDEPALYVRAAFRYHYGPSYRNRALGFRLARSQRLRSGP